MIRLSVLFRALPAALLLSVLAVSGCCSGGGSAAPDAPAAPGAPAAPDAPAPDAPPNPFHRDAGAR